MRRGRQDEAAAFIADRPVALVGRALDGTLRRLGDAGLLRAVSA